MNEHMTMIERVARAIYAASHGNNPLGSADGWKLWLPDARAAVVAIVEWLVGELSEDAVWAACPEVKQFTDIEPALPVTCRRCPATEGNGDRRGTRMCRVIAEKVVTTVANALADQIEAGKHLP